MKNFSQYLEANRLLPQVQQQSSWRDDIVSYIELNLIPSYEKMPVDEKTKQGLIQGVRQIINKLGEHGPVKNAPFYQNDPRSERN